MEREGLDRRGSRWEMVSGIVAIFVGIAALGISAYTAYLEHRHSQAEVWPRVEMGVSDEGGGIKLTIVNKGTGPASIRDWKRRLDGKPVTTWFPWVDGIVGRHVPVGSYYKAEVIDTILSPGEAIMFFGTNDPEVGRLFELSPHVTSQTLCYCSVFEDCWIIDSERDKHKPIPVPECPAPGPDSWVGLGEIEWREIASLSGSSGADAGAKGKP